VTIPCWNCGKPITKSENWTPQNKLWIEDIDNCPKQHDFKKCYRDKMQKENAIPEEEQYVYNPEVKRDVWQWIPHDEYKGRWGAPEWVIKHYQSITEFGKCMFDDCFCRTLEKWKSV